MKAFLAALLLLSTVGCTSKTEYGSCIGILEEKDQTLVYRPSWRNIFLGAVFGETVFVPAVVILDAHSCPVGKK